MKYMLVEHGIANGYLNNPEKTAESFIQNPFGNGIIYKTGDLGKWLENGEIEYIGRSDDQIKLRGLRIELGEIENIILKYPNIKNAVVIKQVSKNREFLSAYYTSDRKISISEIRTYLSQFLPRYMVPSYFMALEKLPYTPNGKIDKKSLPLINDLSNNEEYTAPITEFEKQLVKIWENILNIQPIGIHNNFFELGGDSLLAMNLNLELLKITDKIKYSDIFRFPTIYELENEIVNSNEIKPLFSKIENLSDKLPDILNSATKKEKISKYKPQNILLTGATGFLGIHILEQFINNEDVNIYCIIRGKSKDASTSRLKQKLNYYFGNKYDDLINKRIFVIPGDITKSNFGLNEDDLIQLTNSIDLVINSAANVSHFGNYAKIYNTNVKSVQYMIDFCKNFHKKLYHISTLSVSGSELDLSLKSIKKKRWYRTNSKNKVIFDESSLYIGQRLNNVYTRSKFEAEYYILDAISNGLDAYIFRMGNLMPRFEDGVFQENILDNSFINTILSFIKIGSIPDYLLSLKLEFTPVNFAAKAIYKIITNSTFSNKIFHLRNNNTLSVKKFVHLLKNADFDIKVLQEEDFKEQIQKILKDNKSKELLKNLINDFDKDLHLNYNSDIIISSNFTIKYLNKSDFKWPKIYKKYLMRFIDLLKQVI